MLAVFLKQGLLVVFFHTQLLLDRLQLLVEKVLLLRFAHFLFHFGRDLLLKLTHLLLLGDENQRLVQSHFCVPFFQNGLQFLGRTSRYGCHKICQSEWIAGVHSIGEEAQMVSKQWIELGNLSDAAEHFVRQGSDCVINLSISGGIVGYSIPMRDSNINWRSHIVH